MDLTSIAVSLLTASAQSTATSAAVSVLKQSFGNDKAIAQMLTASSNSMNAVASLAAGIGGNLDMTV